MPPGMVADITAIRTRTGRQVWRWGGHYATNKDAMHFEIVCTPEDLATGIATAPPPLPKRPTPPPPAPPRKDWLSMVSPAEFREVTREIVRQEVNRAILVAIDQGNRKKPELWRGPDGKLWLYSPTSGTRRSFMHAATSQARTEAVDVLVWTSAIQPLPEGRPRHDRIVRVDDLFLSAFPVADTP